MGEVFQPATLEAELQWICGEDPRLECRRHINSGAFGDVYEVRFLRDVPR